MKNILTLLILCVIVYHTNAQDAFNTKNLTPNDLFDPDVKDDSIVKYKYNYGEFVRSEKYIERFDDFGNMIEKAFLLIDYMGRYDTSWLTSYVHDGAKNLITQTDFSTNQETNQLTATRKQEFAYDSQGNRTMESNHYWDKDLSIWKNGTKYIHEYNTDNKLSKTIYSTQATSTDDWELHEKSEFLYLNDKIHEVYFDRYTQSNGQWELKSKSTFTYESNEVIECGYSYDEATNEFNLEAKTTQKLNTDGFILSEIHMVHYAFLDSMIVHSETLYEYNNQNQLTHNSYKYYNHNSDQWTYSYYYDYTYNDLGQQTGKLSKRWLTYSNKFQNEYLSTIEYQSDSSDMQITNHDWDIYSETWDPKNRYDIIYGLIEYPHINKHYYYSSQGEFKISYIDYYYNSVAFNLNFPDYPVSDMTLFYPNPATEQIRFYHPLEQGNRIEIWSVNGQVMQIHQAVEGQSQLVLQGIPAGVYILNIQNNGRSQSQKLIIE